MSDKIQDQPAGATPLDDVSGLQIPEITTRGALDEVEAINILEAVEWSQQARGVGDVFTVPFYRELHRRMFHQVWAWAGETRTTAGTNIGVPGTSIVPELGQLAMEADQRWDAGGGSTSFYAWYHHRAVWIHPYLNRNGRWSRLICDAARVRKDKASALVWSNADLGNAGDERDEYIATLKAADAGDIGPLEDYIAVRNPDL